MKTLFLVCLLSVFAAGLASGHDRIVLSGRFVRLDGSPNGTPLVFEKTNMGSGGTGMAFENRDMGTNCTLEIVYDVQRGANPFEYGVASVSGATTNVYLRGYKLFARRGESPVRRTLIGKAPDSAVVRTAESVRTGRFVYSGGMKSAQAPARSGEFRLIPDAALTDFPGLQLLTNRVVFVRDYSSAADVFGK